MNNYGWDYAPGSDNDPRAPWNKDDYDICDLCDEQDLEFTRCDVCEAIICRECTRTHKHTENETRSNYVP